MKKWPMHLEVLSLAKINEILSLAKINRKVLSLFIDFFFSGSNWTITRVCGKQSSRLLQEDLVEKVREEMKA